MTFWIQHGYGKGDKIDRARQAGVIHGVVLSPAHEERAGLRALVAELQAHGLTPLLDPQLYVYAIAGGTARQHRANGVEVQGVHWSADPDTVRGHVRQILDANTRLGVIQIVSPSPLQTSFVDSWAPLALQYARRTRAEVGDGDRVYVSLVIDEGGLSSWDATDEWLDVATQLDVRGFYIVIARGQTGYPLPWQAERLGNLLRMIYRLAHLNGYEVLLGYSDLEGLGAIALGASMATGWSFTLRRFHESTWQPNRAFGVPQPRVMSERLLVPLLATEAAVLLHTRPELVTGDAEVRRLVAGGGWSVSDSRRHHLIAMGQLAQRVSQGEMHERLNRLMQMIAEARKALATTAIAAGPTYDAALTSLETALARLRNLEHLGP